MIVLPSRARAAGGARRVRPDRARALPLVRGGVLAAQGPDDGARHRLVLLALAAISGLAVIGVLVLVFALAMAYPNLPALDTITDYRPKMPLRIFTADNVLIGEFGEERGDVAERLG